MWGGPVVNIPVIWIFVLVSPRIYSGQRALNIIRTMCETYPNSLVRPGSSNHVHNWSELLFSDFISIRALIAFIGALHRPRGYILNPYICPSVEYPNLEITTVCMNLPMWVCILPVLQVPVPVSRACGTADWLCILVDTVNPHRYHHEKAPECDCFQLEPKCTYRSAST